MPGGHVRVQGVERPDPRYLAGKVDFDRGPNFTAWHLIIPTNQRRVSLHIVGPNANRVTVTNDPAGTIDNGITFGAGFGELYMDYWTDGDIVQKPWYGINSVPANVLAWVEVEDLSM